MSVAFRILALCCALSWVHAYAALGGDAASVQADGTQLHAAVSSTAFGAYERRDLDLASGGVIREFLDDSGTVFAVTWHTPVPPDLKQLLGERYADFTDALRALDHPGLHRSVHLVRAGLIVDASGRPRAYQGRAYLPAALPAGVPLEALH